MGRDRAAIRLKCGTAARRFVRTESSPSEPVPIGIAEANCGNERGNR